jgi:predicted permease
MTSIGDWLRQARFRFRAYFRKSSLEADMAEELRSHLEMEAEANQRTGMLPDDARLAALRQFGGTEQVKEQCRAERRWLSLEQVAKDIRLALRSLANAPGFSAVAVATLALGIAISTSTFSLTNVALLRTLPFPEGERLVRIYRTAPESSALWHSPRNFLDLRMVNTCFSHVSATYIDSYNVAVAEGVPEQTQVLHATAEFLVSMKVQPVLGRGFTADEDQPGRGAVAILTNSYWRRKFDADPNVLGRTLTVNSERLTVIGVLPPEFDSTPVWFGLNFIRPLTLWPNYASDRAGKWFDLCARLKPGVTLQAAQTELSALAARFAKDDPANNGGQGLRVVPLASSNIDDTTRKIYWLTTGLALLVLMIACANLTGVQLARAFNRSHEMAIRGALGAGRLALMGPLLAESLILSGVGGVAGVFLASCLNNIITALNPGSGAIPMDTQVLLFAAVATFLACVAFGLTPAWLVSRHSPAAALKEAGRASTGSRAQRRLKTFLIVGQLALAFVLLSAALTFTVALRGSMKRELGWKSGHLITGAISLPYALIKDKSLEREATQSLQTSVGQVPGITRVSVAHWVPIQDYFTQEKLYVEGQAQSLPGQEPIASTNAIDSSFLDLLQIPLREGRTFQADLTTDSPPVVLINESTARCYWPRQSALGKRLRFAPDAPWMEVIGVVGDVHMAANFRSPVTPFQIYRSLAQAPDRYCSFVVESALPIAALEKSLRQTIARIHPDIMVDALGPMEGLLDGAVTDFNFLVLSLSLFAALGLLIAMIGLYGVMAQLALQRQREMAVRLALGAEPRAVMRLLLSQAARLVAVGIALGAFGVALVYHALHLVLPELPLPGVLWQLGLALALGLVGVGAGYLPARKASRSDPMTILRTE